MRDWSLAREERPFERPTAHECQCKRVTACRQLALLKLRTHPTKHPCVVQNKVELCPLSDLARAFGCLQRLAFELLVQQTQ
jgi:hypothetical protein